MVITGLMIAIIIAIVAQTLTPLAVWILFAVLVTAVEVAIGS